MNRMNGLVFLVAGLLFVFLLAGCAGVISPVSGIIYTGVRSPIAIANNNDYLNPESKVGTASCFSLFGLFAFGDASTKKAMENGGITKVYSVDCQSNSFLGLIAKYKTIVTGEGEDEEEEKTETMEAPKKNIDNN